MDMRLVVLKTAKINVNLLSMTDTHPNRQIKLLDTLFRCG